MRRLALAPLFLALAALSVHSQVQKSATFDEPINLFHGLRMLATRDASVPMDYAPLPRVAAALSAKLLGPPLRHSPERTPWAPGIQPHLAQRVLHRENDADGLLRAGRLAFLPLQILLPVAVYLSARRLWGPRGALASLLLAALSPSLLAHAPLVTADFSVTAFVFLAFALAWTAAGRSAVPRLLTSGLALGLALLSKFSALFAVPVLPLCFAARAAATRRPAAQAAAAGLLVATAGCVVWAAYSFRYLGLKPLARRRPGARREAGRPRGVPGAEHSREPTRARCPRHGRGPSTSRTWGSTASSRPTSPRT
jgi:hypothetical protein